MHIIKTKTASLMVTGDKFLTVLRFIIFAGLILLVNWTFRLPVDRIGELNNRLADAEKQVNRLTSLRTGILAGGDHEDNTAISTGSDAVSSMRHAAGRINEYLSAIKNNRSVVRRASTELNEFSSSLSSFEAAMNNLILIAGEKGNTNNGVIGRWLSISRVMQKASDDATGETRKKFNRIRQLEREYLLNGDISALRDISETAEDVRNEIVINDQGISVNDIDTYIVLTGNLVSIEKRMGRNNSQGIVPELEKSVRQLNVDFAALSNAIGQQAKRAKTFWNIVRYTALVLLVSLFTWLFVKIFSLAGPIGRLAEFTKRISSGELPDEKPDAGNRPDLKATGELLEKHVASLKDKLSFVKALNGDMLDGSLTKAGEDDTLGDELIRLREKILETNEKQAKNEQDNLVRRYMNEGLAKFAEVLRMKSDDIDMLGDAFIKEIVKYLNAVQGGFFVYDDSNPAEPVLNLVSSFAYDRKKYLEQSVKLCEGLVGTCAKERQHIYLTEIPEGYISITSGLGDTPPGNLLLLPVLHDDEILGVLEIASLRQFREHEIEFAKEAALSLGATLVNTRNNRQTTELLRKSQQQAVELSEKEEEMRQNMEELKATQEESARREEAYRGIAEAAGNALMVVEYDLDGTIGEVNENLCRFLGRERDKIRGKQHHEVFKGSLTTDAVFWRDLELKGKIQITENIMTGRKSFEITEHFAMVTDRNNNPVKYINFATDGRVGNS